MIIFHYYFFFLVLVVAASVHYRMEYIEDEYFSAEDAAQALCINSLKGCVDVVLQLYQRLGKEAIFILDKIHLYDERIWNLYIHCQQNIECVREKITDMYFIHWSFTD